MSISGELDSASPIIDFKAPGNVSIGDKFDREYIVNISGNDSTVLYPLVSGKMTFSGIVTTSTLSTSLIPLTFCRIPYTNEYYPGGDVAVGGAAGGGTNGGNGCVILEYQTGGGGSININGEWHEVETTYVKNNGAWNAVTTSYILQNRLWRPIQGVPIPTFTEFQGFIGTASRSYGGALTPPPPHLHLTCTSLFLSQTQGAQEIHAYIRSWIADMYDKATADGVRIQYGGSVAPDNVDKLMSCPGVLV
jgi:hypothetical protein